MAKVDIKMPDEFLERMSRLGKDFDAVAESVLEAGGSGTKYDSRSTGELESALGLTPAKTDKDGNHNVKVGFAEPRSDGTSNAKLANILEYGKHGQPAKPFLKPAKSASRSACKAAMQQKFEEEVRKL